MTAEKVDGSGFITFVLVVSICAFIGSFLIIGFVPSLVAAFLGHTALKRIRESQGRLGGLRQMRCALALAYSGIVVSLVLAGLLGFYLIKSGTERVDPERKAIARSLRGKSAEQVEEQIMGLLDAGRQRDAENIAFCIPPRLAGDLRLNFIQGVLRRSRWSQMDAAFFFRRVREIDPNTKEGKAARLVMDIDRGWYADRNMQELAGLMEEYPEDMMITWLFAMSCREYFKNNDDTRYSEAGRKAYQKLDEFWGVGPSLFHQTYANVLRELDLCSEALPHYQKAVELEPASWSYKGLLVCLREVGDKEISVDTCRAAFELNPGDDDIIHEWGRALERQGKYTEAAAKFEEAMQQGNVYSANGLAKLYEQGKGVEKNLDKARELFEKSAEMGNAYALYNLAKMYRDAVGVKVDRNKAEELYLQAVEKGHEKALEDLGFMYDRGLGGPKDKVKAAKYYQKAAEAGLGWSAWKLACLYYDDPLMERDYEKSLKYFLLADQLKHDDASMYACIGSQYYKGLGVQTNVLKAIEWWEKGAALNNPYSVNMLGHCYTYGIGVDRDIPKALKIYKTALKNGVKLAADAMFRMPYEHVDEYRKLLAEDNDVWNYKVLIHAMFGLERYDECIETCRTALAVHPADGDIVNYWGLCLERQGKFEEAAVKYREGIEAGNHWSYHNLALFLRNGSGVQKDLNKARELYEKSSSMGNARAAFSLGEIYRDGLGCERDGKKAESYFLKAGNGGYSDGFAAVGMMFLDGSVDGVIDKNKGIKYLERSADQGNAWAAFQAGMFYYNGTVKEDLPKAVEWWERGASNGDIYSLRWLAYCYETGKGVTQDFQRAVQILSKVDDCRCRGSLAGLYSRAGRFEEAVKAQKEAIALLEKQHKDAWDRDPELREKELKPYREEMLLFESEQPSDKWY